MHGRTIGAVMAKKPKQTKCIWCDSLFLDYLIRGHKYHFTPIGVVRCENARGEFWVDKDNEEQPYTDDACPHCDGKIPKHKYQGKTYHWVTSKKSKTRKPCGLINMLPVLRLTD